ncbi:hypothetical protein D3C85_1720700 [compost metagenome]
MNAEIITKIRAIMAPPIVGNIAFIPLNAIHHVKIAPAHKSKNKIAVLFIVPDIVIS